MLSLVALISLTTQTVYLLVRRTWWQPWWRVALVFAALMLTVHQVVWEGFPGAVMRVVLPLTIGFNVLLSAHEGSGFWIWYVLGNLQLAYALTVLPSLGPRPLAAIAAAADSRARPRPLEVEAADAAVHVQDLAGQIETRTERVTPSSTTGSRRARRRQPLLRRSCNRGNR